MADKQDNLLRGHPPTQFKSGQQAVEAGRKGGIASGKAKKERKTFKQTTEWLLSLTLTDGELDEEKIKTLAELKGAPMTTQQAIMLAQFKKAMRGDTRAAEFVLQAMGEQSGQDNADVLNKLDEVLGEIGGVI